MKALYEFFQSFTADGLIHLLPDDQIRHSINVEILVSCLVRWLPPSGENNLLQYFSKAAYYHDIGKVCVPPYILNKLGSLTMEEFNIIRQHPKYAKEVFSFYKENGSSQIPSFLFHLTADAAYYHHEWWNGEGYPYGLKEYEIPYVARVTSICDAYDAMVSQRPYHNAFSHTYACNEIREGIGTQFDPLLAKIFLKHEHEFSHIVEEICTYPTCVLAEKKGRIMQMK